VSLEVPAKNKHYLTPLQRYTVAVVSSVALTEAHREFTERNEEFNLTAIEAVQDTRAGQSFQICDLDRNWWEVAYIAN
jgi:hypothetical protein